MKANTQIPNFGHFWVMTNFWAGQEVVGVSQNFLGLITHTHILGDG